MANERCHVAVGNGEADCGVDKIREERDTETVVSVMR